MLFSADLPSAAPFRCRPPFAAISLLTPLVRVGFSHVVFHLLFLVVFSVLECCLFFFCSSASRGPGHRRRCVQAGQDLRGPEEDRTNPHGLPPGPEDAGESLVRPSSSRPVLSCVVCVCCAWRTVHTYIHEWLVSSTLLHFTSPRCWQRLLCLGGCRRCRSAFGGTVFLWYLLCPDPRLSSRAAGRTFIGGARPGSSNKSSGSLKRQQPCFVYSLR